MDPIRFRLAARIHFALLRQYGEDVEVAALLRGSREAREALWVCEASSDVELAELAAQFKQASIKSAPKQAADIPAAHAPQDTAWSRNTSGFGVSISPGLAATAHPSSTPARTRLNPANWLRRGDTTR